MTAIKISLSIFLIACAAPVLAETPQELVKSYTAEVGHGFTPSAVRGKEFFLKERNVSQKMPSCVSCHGKDLNAAGEHIITHKRIDPLSPTVNAERFTSMKKVEKWFKRNCTEVVGRECTASEKADYIQFVIQGGKI